MAEPLKNLFNPNVIGAAADVLTRLDGFDRAAFDAVALPGLDGLEMMQRSAQVSRALAAALPDDYPAILTPLAALLHPDCTSEISGMPSSPDGLRGWICVSLGHWVAERGLGHPSESLDFLRHLTQRFSAEFAVRPFFRDHPDLTLDHATRWARDANFHTRRLASEGSRPRLPWGIRLNRFIDDPAPLVPILTALRDDPSEYVRRSVANNLNDIAKDHPELVAGIAGDWLQDAPAPRRKLVKHACRSLIKAGHAETLALFGYGPPDGLRADLHLAPASIVLGNSLALTATLRPAGTAPQPVLIDIVMRFLRADGSHGTKVFKWTSMRLPPGRDTVLSRKLPLRDVTTRRHYPGKQFAALQVNGEVVAEAPFELRLPG